MCNRPKNLFVASHGTPPMNFISGNLVRDGRRRATSRGIIPAALIDREHLTGSAVVLGIRPHNFKVVHRAENALTLSVDYIEHLGKENLYRCQMEETSVRVITPINERHPTNEPLYVAIDIKTLNIFDEASGDNITRVYSREGGA